jgi:tRNA wybutosine-synthesizing protein 3
MPRHQEPPPGLGHYSAVVDDEVWMWGGHTKSSPKSNEVWIYNPQLEEWRCLPTDGKQPSTLYYGAATSVGSSMYIYGGQEENPTSKVFTNSLYKLDLDASRSRVIWTLLDSNGPMKCVGCRMVNYKKRLILFGGYEQPSPSLESHYRSMNLLFEFDLDKGTRVTCNFTFVNS